MSATKDRVYDLLPAIYRQRDAEREWPLKALLRVIAEEVDLVEADIEQLHQNWFIETCEDWVVPYIGDLIGYRLVHEAGPPGDPSTPAGRERNRILFPRREVANTVRYRRRKGTLALLELLARDVANWPARAVEFCRLLSVTPSVRLAELEFTASQTNDSNDSAKIVPLGRGTIDIRQGDVLDRLDGPFDESAHTVEIRRVDSHRTQGRFNIPSIGLYVWRLRAYSVSRAKAYCLEQVGAHCYTFSVLGNDSRLYVNPTTEEDPTQIAGALNLPTPIGRRALQADLADAVNEPRPSQYYGVDKSLVVWEKPPFGQTRTDPVPLDRIVVADLSGWQYRPYDDQVAVDPVLGRIAFPPNRPPRQDVWVTYHYGFSADMGGGEYHRSVARLTDNVYRVGRGETHATVGSALGQWGVDKLEEAVIEITDSGDYVEQLHIEFETGQSLTLRAADGQRPVIRVLDFQTGRPDAIRVTAAGGDHVLEDSEDGNAGRTVLNTRFCLDGVLVTGRGVRIDGALSDFTLRHSTLVPGWTLDTECHPQRPSEPSLELWNTGARVRITHSILGPVQVNHDEVTTDPLEVHIADSVLDGADPHGEVLGAPGRAFAHATLTIERSTVFGCVQTHAIALAENSIFNGLVCVARRQIGCMRFCYAPPESRTPRRYHCEPDIAVAAAGTGPEKRRAEQRVRPRFDSISYGTPIYARLALHCADEIRRGADDRSEMGVFHDLYQPQRGAMLQTRLDEFIPAEKEGGILYAD